MNDELDMAKLRRRLPEIATKLGVQLVEAMGLCEAIEDLSGVGIAATFKGGAVIKLSLRLPEEED